MAIEIVTQLNGQTKMLDSDEYEFILQDRIAKIQSVSQQYDLDNESYISFSGGKDSVVLSKLIDLAIPNNKIKRVYKDTGIEYRLMRKFVRECCKNDSRFIYIKPDRNIKKTLLKYGYPFKSKQFAHNWLIYRNNIDLCEEYRNKIDNDKSLIDNLNFIKGLPKGVNSFI